MLPSGAMVFTGGYSFQTATREYFESGPVRNFPLNGRYTGSTFSMGLRAGLARNLELEFVLPVRVNSYESDPVVVLPRPAGMPGGESDFDYYQRNIINLSRTASGIGDIFFAVRYRLAALPFPFAFELRAKIPTGYNGPSGTFGSTPRTREEFEANPYQFVTPANVRDDVTLGDGQVDLTPSLLFGYAFSTRTFVRADAGYNLRLGGAGHPVQGALRAGQSLGDRLLVYGWIQAAMTVTQGRVLGISVAAINPDLPAADYNATDNILLRELRFERDIIDVGAGLIVRLTPEVELNAGYQRTLWGRNTGQIDALNLSLAVRTRVAR